MDFVRRGTVAVAVAVAVMSGLGACSKPSPNAKSSPTPSTRRTPAASPSPVTDPCRLLTPQDISAALGGTVTVGTPGDFLGSPLCNFTVTTSSVGPTLQLQLYIPLNYPASNFATSKALTPTNTVVTGVGDDAFYDTVTGGLVFLKGTTYIEVAAQFPQNTKATNPTKLQTAIIALATTAAKNF